MDTYKLHQSIPISRLFDSNTMSKNKVVPHNITHQPIQNLILGVFECKCKETAWLFGRSGQDHIINRKCNISLPKSISSF